MKKLSLNAKFITTSLFCLALLAVPALAVQGQALYYAAPQPRPQSADRRPAYLSTGPAGRGRGHKPFPAKPYRGRTQRHLRHGKVYR